MRTIVFEISQFIIANLPKPRKSLRDLISDESGVGVIEVVLILVVLIGLVAIFKNQINELLTTIFESINTHSNEIL